MQREPVSAPIAVHPARLRKPEGSAKEPPSRGGCVADCATESRDTVALIGRDAGWRRTNPFERRCHRSADDFVNGRVQLVRRTHLRAHLPDALQEG